MILLTGPSGFIGKHLLNALIKKEGVDNIIAFTSKPIDGCNYLLHNNYIFGENYFFENNLYDKIDTIIHAGAFTPKNAKQGNDWQNCNSNILSTGSLLGANLPNLKKFIYLSTLDVYADEAIISEESNIDPISLYANSKLYGEKMIIEWANTNKKIFQVLRVGHVYGPGEQEYQKVIPNIIKRILNKQPIEIWGSGEEIRSFIYINDVVEAILNAVDLNESIGIVNLVGGHQITIKELVYKLIEFTGENKEIEFISTDEKKRNLVFDNTKLMKFLLSEELPIEDGLKKEWQYMNVLK